ncbi:MAG: BolA family transcriptional regulator [Deltaproteobacteria bacterium]|nr:BolA family transcriptional regulator [Deltaproteobacteria bacterium]
MQKDKLIHQAIQAHLPNAHIEVEDTMGDQNHFQATVVSEEFEGKTLLEQHQVVYKALQELLKEQVHALALKTYTPSEWQSLSS